MGASALSPSLLHLSASQYRCAAAWVEAALRTRWPGLRVTRIPSYRTKTDFDKLDVLIEASPDFDAAQAAHAIGARTSAHNGPVTICTVADGPAIARAFRADLIAIDPEEFHFSLRYFSYNDLGALLRRVAQKAGFDLNPRGLFHTPGESGADTPANEKVLVTRNWSQTLEFLGYKPEDYRDFETLEDVFAFVGSTPYFNFDMFVSDSHNQGVRAQDRMRELQNTFLGWARTRSDLPKFVWSREADLRAAFMCRALAQFPTFHLRQRDPNAREAPHQAWAQQFSAQRVKSLTGSSGSRISEIMRVLRRIVPPDKAADISDPEAQALIVSAWRRSHCCRGLERLASTFRSREMLPDGARSRDRP